MTGSTYYAHNRHAFPHLRNLRALVRRFDLILVLHHRLRQHREDAGALHHLAGIRRSAVVRVGVFPGTGHVPAHCAVTPIPGAVRPLPDSRAVMADARRRGFDPLRILTIVFLWARWRNNNLWNLLPARRNINLSKSDRLPSSGANADARCR